MNAVDYLEKHKAETGAGVAEPPQKEPLETEAPDGDIPSPSTESDEVVFEPVERYGLTGLVELILKDRPRLHRLIRDAELQPELMPRFLAVSLIAFVFYGAAISVVLTAAGVWPELTAIEAWLGESPARLIAFAPLEETVVAPWLNGSALVLVAAYAVGLVAATGVCLPSLYFYGLLSGVRMSMLDVTIHALKAKATAAVALVGILPVYAAAGLAVVIFPVAASWLHATLLLGLILPFIAGLWGTYSLHQGFATLADTLPEDCRERRSCFLRRLVLSWSAIYTAVTPVMIFTLWEYFA